MPLRRYGRQFRSRRPESRPSRPNRSRQLRRFCRPLSASTATTVHGRPTERRTRRLRACRRPHSRACIRRRPPRDVDELRHRLDRGDGPVEGDLRAVAGVRRGVAIPANDRPVSRSAVADVRRISPRVRDFHPVALLSSWTFQAISRSRPRRCRRTRSGCTTTSRGSPGERTTASADERRNPRPSFLRLPGGRPQPRQERLARGTPPFDVPFRFDDIRSRMNADSPAIYPQDTPTTPVRHP